MSAHPFTYRETVLGDESAVRARIEEIWAHGLQIPDPKYNIFQNPAVIQQIRYPKF